MHAHFWQNLAFVCGLTMCGSAHALDASAAIVESAEPLPLYEVGLGAVEAYLPDYPGANQSHLQTLPVPYVVYRGETMRMDQNGGARAKFFDGEIYEFNLSASGGLPTNLTHDDAREGMPALDWTVELGPRLLIRLAKWDFGGTLKFGLPLRAMFSTDFAAVRGHGFLFAPELRFEITWRRTRLFSLLTTESMRNSITKWRSSSAPRIGPSIKREAATSKPTSPLAFIFRSSTTDSNC
jgi:hypothetical protein